MVKLFMTAIVLLHAKRFHALTFSRLRNLRSIQTQLRCTSTDERSEETLKRSAILYCLKNFGSIAIPETEEKDHVKFYQNFDKDYLFKKLEYLQANEDYHQAKQLKLLRQKIISTSNDLSSGKLYSTSL